MDVTIYNLNEKVPPQGEEKSRREFYWQYKFN
jgi:hypothetical protein